MRRIHRAAPVVAGALTVLLALANAQASPVATADAAAVQVSDQIAGKLQRRRMAVAIPDLGTLEGRVTVLGRYLAEELVTNLFARGVPVVERSLLHRVLSELRLGDSDLMNPAHVKRFGQLVGAQAIIVGTLTDLGDAIKFNIRVVEIETGQVIAAGATQFIKDAGVDAMLAEDAPQRLPRDPVLQSPSQLDGM